MKCPRCGCNMREYKEHTCDCGICYVDLQGHDNRLKEETARKIIEMLRLKCVCDGICGEDVCIKEIKEEFIISKEK